MPVPLGSLAGDTQWMGGFPVLYGPGLAPFGFSADNFVDVVHDFGQKLPGQSVQLG
ncbi:MAG: hypothetical protein AB7F88_09535 [Pyrinomonadaceae bacterium]